LASGQWQWSAWLSAQGRVRALFRLLRTGDDALRAMLRGGTAEEFRRQLSPFVLRSKLRLDVAPVPQAFGCFEVSDVRRLLGRVRAGRNIVVAEGRTGIGVDDQASRWIVFGKFDEPQATAQAPAISRWRAADIVAGLAELAPGQEDRFVPAALGLGR